MHSPPVVGKLLVALTSDPVLASTADLLMVYLDKKMSRTLLIMLVMLVNIVVSDIDLKVESELSDSDGMKSEVDVDVGDNDIKVKSDSELVDRTED